MLSLIPLLSFTTVFQFFDVNHVKGVTVSSYDSSTFLNVVIVNPTFATADGVMFDREMSEEECCGTTRIRGIVSYVRYAVSGTCRIIHIHASV